MVANSLFLTEPWKKKPPHLNEGNEDYGQAQEKGNKVKGKRIWDWRQSQSNQEVLRVTNHNKDPTPLQ